MVTFKTNTETSEAGIVLPASTYAFPTRLAAFQHRRHVGTLVNYQMIYTPVYSHSTFDAPPGDPRADERRTGLYVLNVYDLDSGQFLTQHIPVEHTTRLPKEAPGETLDEGAIVPPEEGFSISAHDSSSETTAGIRRLSPMAKPRKKKNRISLEWLRVSFR